jgi:hypothetical protein
VVVLKGQIEMNEIRTTIISSISGIIGVGLGVIGTLVAAKVTNRIQQQIADRNIDLQKKIAESSLALQKQIADSQSDLQRDLAKENNRAHQRALIDGMVLKMLEFLMEYPHLEKDEFCKSYPDVKGHPNGKERYEAFCCFVFNLLMAAFKHFDEDVKKLGDYIGIDEIVRSHHRWWEHDRENLNYDEPFRRAIQAVIDRLKKEGKI